MTVKLHLFNFHVFTIVTIHTPIIIKGTLWGLRQILETESPLKMMKSFFYLTLKALFVLKIFKF